MYKQLEPSTNLTPYRTPNHNTVRGNNPWSDNDIENIIEEETIVRLRNLCGNEYVGTRIESEKQENGIKTYYVK